MKTPLITAILLFNLTAFAQNSRNELSHSGLDENGSPIPNILADRNEPYFQQPNLLTTFTYDTVRPLSEINVSGSADAYSNLTADGLRLYYTHETSFNVNSLAFTERADTNSFFSGITNIPLSVTNATSFWISDDELDVYFTKAASLYYAHRNSVASAFNTAIQIILNGITLNFIAAPSLNITQNELYLYSTSPVKSVHQYVRTSATAFSYVATVPLPTGYSSGPGQLSKDDLTFFLAASYNGGKSQLHSFTRSNPTDTFNVNSFRLIEDINDTLTYASNTQPSMSAGLNWVTFTRSLLNSWQENDLFIAHLGTISAVFNPEDNDVHITLFPNPTDGYFSIKINLSVIEKEKASIVISNVMGVKLACYSLSESLHLTGYPKGVYLIKIYSGKSTFSKRIVLQ